MILKEQGCPTSPGNANVLSEKFLIGLFASPHSTVSQFGQSERRAPTLPVSDGIDKQTLMKASKRLLALAQNFEQEMPGLKHLQSIYLPKLEEMVLESQ